MKISKSGDPSEESPTQSELEKLLEQKQHETEALKRLIHVLDKLDPQKNDQADPR